jgi:mannitol-1-phosphate 5-dehydrogenase
VAVGRGSWSDRGKPEFVGDDARELVIDRTRTLTPIPALPGVQGTRHYLPMLRGKLYVFNAGHAVCAYLGWLRGHQTVPAAVTDPLLRPMVAGCMLEARSAVVEAHPEIGAEVEGPVATALRRFADRELADPIVRVARDPIRKLSPRDRLLGPVGLIGTAVGAVPANFSLSIAATLLYRHDGDAQALELGYRLAEAGVVTVLGEVCHLPPDDPLTEVVAARYRGFIIDGDQTIFPPAHGRDLIGARHTEAW